MAVPEGDSTEKKIQDAARMIFTKKGFLATTIRDIATEADINVASINYYFRSKEKLFAFIMDETIGELFNRIEPVLNDEALGIKEKMEICVGYYIDHILKNPDFVFFTVSEVKSGSTNLSMVNKMKPLDKSHFAQQLKGLHSGDRISYHPVNLLWNLMGI